MSLSSIRVVPQTARSGYHRRQRIPVADIKLQIGDELRPLSEQDQARRAYFFVCELELRSLNYLTQATAARGSTPTKDVLDDTVKLLTWVTIYLSAVYCGGVEAQSWLLDFIARALRIADEYTINDDTKKFLKNLGSLKEDALTKKAASRAATRLSVRDETFEKETVEFLAQNSQDALDLLTTSLVLPIDTLRDLVQLINIQQ
jgi:hypothetical protein